MKGIRRIEKILFRVILRPQNTPIERHGSGYGGWTIPAGLLDRRAVVYSGGVGEDATFDLSLISTYGCLVHAFDPTPRSIAFARGIEEPEFRFLPIGLWSEDSRKDFLAPEDPNHVSHSISANVVSNTAFSAECRSIPSLMRELGHDQIALLKIDIEGAEYEVLPAMLSAGVAPRAICVEFHGGVRRALRLVRQLRRSGYAPVAVDGWDVTFVVGRTSNAGV